MATKTTRADIDFMLKQFKPERYAYLTVTIASFILLIVCIILFIKDQKEMTKENLGYIAGMVGTGGAIAYTASQLLRMWRDCMALLSSNKTVENDK